MTQEQDIIERLQEAAGEATLKAWSVDVGKDKYQLASVLFAEAAQTIAALRAERDEWARQAMREDDCRKIWQERAIAAEARAQALSKEYERAMLQKQEQVLTAIRERDEDAQRIEDAANLASYAVKRAEAAEARVKELEEGLAYDAMMADQLCTALERREARITELELIRDSHSRDTLAALLERNTAIRERDELRRQAIVDFGQIQTALEERDEARKALEPFAKASEKYPPGLKDTDAPVGFRGFNLGGGLKTPR